MRGVHENVRKVGFSAAGSEQLFPLKGQCPRGQRVLSADQQPAAQEQAQQATAQCTLKGGSVGLQSCFTRDGVFDGRARRRIVTHVNDTEVSE